MPRNRSNANTATRSNWRDLRLARGGPDFSPSWPRSRFDGVNWYGDLAVEPIYLHN